MDADGVKKYIGKKVFLELKNGFKFTAVIPDFSGTSFEITDKYGQWAYIDCDSIALIYQREDDMNEKKTETDRTE